jgi:CRP/FNR family transcriptional regulator, cyclic AMP receptor protein
MLKIEKIQNYSLFTGLTINELEKIAPLCQRRTYESNSVILTPDTFSAELFILEGGNDAIQIEVPLSKFGNNIVIHTLTKGETFGWASLGFQHIKTARVRCLERVEVVAINAKGLMDLFERDNHIGYIVMRNLADIISNRLSNTTVAFRHMMREMRKTVPV